MLKSRLFLKIFSALILVIAGLASAMWLFTVPLVERKAYEIELEASRTILDNVFEMAAKMAGRLDETRGITLKYFEGQVRAAVSLAVGFIEDIEKRRARGELSDEEARRLTYESLRSLQYGNNDYVWVSDYDANILSHPDARYHGRNVSSFKDETGEGIIPRVIEIARKDGEGSWIYDWTRLGSGKTTRKIAYFRDLPKLKIVVGSGAYLDDIDAEVERRRIQAIDDMRKALREIRIARTGYAYIFDAANNMIIHPNSNIEGTEFTTRSDPKTGKPISDELKAVADTDHPLHYMWDKPTDPGNYVYEKISWVRHFKEFDWYIASSVYVEELQSSSQVLGRRILLVAGSIGLVAGIIGWFGIWRIVRPLQRLAHAAERVTAGDLSVETGIRRSDEIGVLASTFDAMIGRVRENVTLLGERVRERTLELERANTTLAEVESRQRLILDAIPAAIAYLDVDETFRFVNRAWSELIGKPKAAIVGAKLEPVIGSLAYRAITPPLARTRAGEPVVIEYAFNNRVGQRIVTTNTLIPQMGADGIVTGCFVLTRDVTAEKETERRIFEAEHMKAMAQLSGGLAHDFNNLLSIIIGNLATAREKYADVPGLVAYMEPAERASRRGADLTSRLLSFARQQPMRSEPVEVVALLQETVKLLARTVPQDIDIDLEAEDDDRGLWIQADHIQLERAVVNLALNARDALPRGGRITLRCRRLETDGTLTYDEPVPPGRWIEIAVEDTGSGFSEEGLKRAFEPFFTTKKSGSGLGLAMVWGFAKQSHGYIRIASEEGRGACVSLLLGEHDAPVDAFGTEIGGDGEALFPGELALVVDDDDDVRRVMLEHMIGLGFSVIEAESGEEALSLLDGIAGIRFIVSDIVMPGLSGRDLARAVRTEHPGVAVVLVTGFARELSEDRIEGVPVLAKPWEKQDLITALTSALRAAPKIEKDAAQ